MSSPLTRYRVVAYAVGVVLILLVGVAMPLKYLADEPVLVEAIGPFHGALYIVYLVVTFQLSMRQRWSLGRMLLLMLAGTVPVVSFVAERWVTARVREQEPVPAA